MTMYRIFRPGVFTYDNKDDSRVTEEPKELLARVDELRANGEKVSLLRHSHKHYWDTVTHEEEEAIRNG